MIPLGIYLAVRHHKKKAAKVGLRASTTQAATAAQYNYDGAPPIESTKTYRRNDRRESSTSSASEFERKMAPAAVQDVQRPTTDRNTGFPEPLSPDRNTTLPHPEADTSKGAAIEAPDVPLHRTHSRNRSFLSRHHSAHHHASHHHKNGAVRGADESKMYDNIQYADGSMEKKSSPGVEQNLRIENGVVNGEGTDGEHELDCVGGERDEHGYKIGERRKGVLRKLRLHKV